MLDGLPTEVVEAVARALPTHVDDLSFIGDVRLRVASRVLAALPACVLVSDGQGHVRAMSREDFAEKVANTAATWMAVIGEEQDTAVAYDGQVQAFRYKRTDGDA